MKLLTLSVLLCVWSCSTVEGVTNQQLSDAFDKLQAQVNTDKTNTNNRIKDAVETMKAFRNDIYSKFRALKKDVNEQISDINSKVNLNNLKITVVEHQALTLKTQVEKLKERFNSMQASHNEQFIAVRQKANEDRAERRDRFTEVRENISALRNRTKADIKSVDKKLKDYKVEMAVVTAGIEQAATNQVDELRADVDADKATTTNKINQVKMTINNVKNRTLTQIGSVWENLGQFKTNIRETVSNSRQDLVDMIQQLESHVDTGDSGSYTSETVKQLARQTMLLQFNMEEKTRFDGDSGIKNTRGMAKGSDNYYEVGLFGPSFNMMHDHSNYERTIGMGEVVVVMNGVEFRTRHNDYKLVMPSRTSTAFHATDPIPLPEVPPSVTGTVEQQIDEMREYFKAFATQDKTHRDYTNYFKPVLCYMEATWTLSTQNLDEPFDSDRHHLDASSWMEMQEKVRFTSYTGTKSRLENFANLPTTIMSVNETTGNPEYAQWNYRILCQPTSEEIPTKEFHQMDDLAYRIPRKRSIHDVKHSRGARFRLIENKLEMNGARKYTKLDRLFYSIPGKDNVPGNLTQESFGETMFQVNTGGPDLPLNTGYYHRYFKFDKAGAMGIKDVARGFNDANMWVAQTTQERIAPIGLKKCNRRGKQCTLIKTRFSYAIPLEIIYLTPLLTWNPYDLDTTRTYEESRYGGRNGNNSPDLAFNGTGPEKNFHMTPVKFFKGKVDQSDPADTVRNAIHVLDKKGEVRRVTASGTKIFLQEIEGIEGQIRLRYPISPIHGEGSPVWKELNALKRLLKDEALAGDKSDTVLMMMTPTIQDPPGEHTHEIVMDREKFIRMYRGGETIEVVTSFQHNHAHTLRLRYVASTNSFKYVKCTGRDMCLDGHPSAVTLVTDISDIRNMMG